MLDSEIGKALAEELIQNIKGIKSVDNQLMVNSEYFQKTADHLFISAPLNETLINITISNKVNSQLLAKHITNGMNIDTEY